MKRNKTIVLVIIFVVSQIIFTYPINNIKYRIDSVNDHQYYDERVESRTKNQLKASTCRNMDNIEAIFDRKLSDYELYAYFPQIYKPSLQATYYGLYILDVLGNLGEINKTTITNYIISTYNQESNLFFDEYSYRYLDTDFSQAYYPLTSLLEVNCYAILSLHILNKLDLIDRQKFIDFIWSCYNPITIGFIGQPYNVDLEDSFKISTMDNTYFAVMALNLLMEDWISYTVRKNEIIQHINDLQDSINTDWRYGGFYNDKDSLFDSIKPLHEPNLLSSYYCIKTLEIFGMEESINSNSFHQFLNELYKDDNYFQMSVFEHNITNLIATTIGLDLSKMTGFSGINETSVINFILDNRNSQGTWHSSTTVTMHELMDLFQVIRALNNSGAIFNLTTLDKSEILTALNNYHQLKGFSLISQEYTSLNLLNTIISSFQLFDRVSDLNIQGIYNEIKNSFRYNNYPKDWYVFLPYINADSLKPEFRSYPIEYYNRGYHNYITSIDYFTSFKSMYFALNSMNTLFKLDDFGGEVDLTNLIEDITQSQFLNSSFPEVYGAFLPTHGFTFFSLESQLQKIFFEYSYYAIKSLELLVDHLNLGNIVDLSFNKVALREYIQRNIVETSSLLYFDPQYTSNIDIILQNTYYMIYVLKALDLYDLNNQKIKEFVQQNINYNKINNIYYSYKISEILDISLEFNYDLVINLADLLYSEDLNEFYMNSNYQIVNQDFFLWICEMALNSELEIECEYMEQIILGGVNSLTVSFQNLIIDDFGDDISVVFESLQLGIINFEELENNTYYKDFKIPENPSCHPKVEGVVAIYKGYEQLGQVPVNIRTFYVFHDSGLKIIDKHQELIFEMNISYEFSSGQNPASNSMIIGNIYRNFLLVESVELEREDYSDLSKFTMYYENLDDIEYSVQFLIYDGFHPDGMILYEYEINPSEPINPGGGTSQESSILWTILALCIFVGICGFSLFVSNKFTKWIFGKKYRRKKENTPLKLELEIKKGKKMKDVFDDILSNEDL
ncbi:MAG: hypothetical protein ACFFAQ_01990 [Promethearchaeota archaeon]